MEDKDLLESRDKLEKALDELRSYNNKRIAELLTEIRRLEESWKTCSDQ